jgi:hypothetical protein
VTDGEVQRPFCNGAAGANLNATTPEFTNKKEFGESLLSQGLALTNYYAPMRSARVSSNELLQMNQVAPPTLAHVVHTPRVEVNIHRNTWVPASTEASWHQDGVVVQDQVQQPFRFKNEVPFRPEVAEEQNPFGQDPQPQVSPALPYPVSTSSDMFGARSGMVKNVNAGVPPTSCTQSNAMPFGFEPDDPSSVTDIGIKPHQTAYAHHHTTALEPLRNSAQAQLVANFRAWRENAHIDNQGSNPENDEFLQYINNVMPENFAEE